MRRTRAIIGLILISILIGFTQIGASASVINTADPNADFNKLVDRYFDDFFKYNPTAGTAAGFHKYDSQLEDYSKAAIDSQNASLKAFLTEFEKVDATKLSADTAADRDLVINNIKATLLENENIRSWEKNPDRYSSGITNSAFVIMSRNYASQSDRLKPLIARERQMPKVFDDARANLKNPPKVYTEVASDQIDGIISFFKNDVPAAFTEVKDATLLAEFKTSNQGVIDALTAYGKFLKDDLLPKSNGDYRIGEDNYRKKLLYEEMVDIPLDRLLRIGFDNLHANQEWFKQTAAKVDPKKRPDEILADLAKDNPAPDKLLQTTRDVLGGLKQYITDHKIITIPSPVLPIVEETPPFARALTTASMDTPGPFEAIAKEAYYNITLPEPTWA